MCYQSIARRRTWWLAGSALLFSTYAAWSFAQAPASQPRPAVVVSGTVRDHDGHPMADASVIFEEKGTSASIDAKTTADGAFSFLALRAGTYIVRARKEGFRETVSDPLELSLGQKKQLDLVLNSTNKTTRQKPPRPSNSPAKPATS